jgi:hypothetical protein
MLYALGVVIQIWLVGAAVTIFVILVLDALQPKIPPSINYRLRTPLQHHNGSLWKPK